MTCTYEWTSIECVRNLFVVNMISNFKGVIAVVMILLFTQQNVAAYKPMNCDDMNNYSIESSKNDSHHTSKMTMHEHGSVAKSNNSSHEKCEICNSGDCICSEMGSCFNSSVLTPAYTVDQESMLFVDHGNRFISINEYPDTGIYLNLFRPPICS